MSEGLHFASSTWKTAVGRPEDSGFWIPDSPPTGDTRNREHRPARKRAGVRRVTKKASGDPDTDGAQASGAGPPTFVRIRS